VILKLKYERVEKMKICSLFVLILIIVSCSSVTDKHDARLSGYRYPFPVQQFKIYTQNQNLEMAYMDLNSKSKNVVVLLHGKNFSGFYWEKIAKDLFKRGFRVIIPDQIGFGKSSKPEYYQYSFAQMALNTKKLLLELNVHKFSLVGHSMGGMLAVTLADKFHESIKKTILINPIGLEDYSRYVNFKDPSFFYKIELNKNIDKIRNYQKKNYYAGKWNSEYEKLITPFAKQIGGPDWPLVAWNNALTYGPIFTENIIDKLKRTRVPTHILLGTRDRTGPGRKWKKNGVSYLLGQYHLMKSKIMKLNRRIKVVNLEELGHLPQFEDYQSFSNIFYDYFPSRLNIHPRQ